MSSFLIMFSGIALLEVTNTIEELIITSTNNPVFMMKDLRVMYQERLRDLNASSEQIDRVNVTRLKEHILKEVHGLREEKKGKCVLLTMDGTAGRAVFEASLNSTLDEGIILSKAASIVRKNIFSHDQSFDGDLLASDPKNSLSIHLLRLLGLILEGFKHFDKVSSKTEDIVVKLAQIIKFNAVKTVRRSHVGDVRRHSKQNEPPLPTLIGLSIHSKTRKKGIVQFLASQGLSISYDRVLQIEDDITKQLCIRYNTEGIVCPPSLKKGLFTIAAIDNIDHDPSSSTAQKSFHGTSISIFQYPDEGEAVPRFVMENALPNICKVQLPPSYTCVLPAKDFKPEPSDRKPHDEHPYFSQTSNRIAEWLSKVNATNLTVVDGQINFASYFSGITQNKMPKTSSTLMPLLEESINSTSMVRHCMNLISELTNHLNSGQVTVITADQPVFAIGKQVEWNYPEKFKNLVWMLGPLHIEMAFMNAIGDWVEGSGWIQALEKAGFSTPGRIESYLSGKKIKRTRYAHQVTLAVLSKLAHSVFQAQTEFEDFESWKESTEKKNANHCFWFQVIKLEKLLFSFILSLRDADFCLFVKCIEEMMPWMFALDHTHYARWMSVFLEDLKQIPSKYPEVFNEFKRGYFTVKNGYRSFSNIGVDQAHEQNNKLVKIDGGAIGILDNPKSLLRWSVAGPTVTKVCHEYDDPITVEKKHHEDTRAVENKFRADVSSVHDAFLEFGNPFCEEEENLIQLSSKIVLEKSQSSTVFQAEQLGKKQFDAFVNERITSDTASLYDIIHKNKLDLFRTKKRYCDIEL